MNQTSSSLHAVAHTSGRRYRVLVVDDTQANRALLRAYLVRLQFDVLMAEDGEQALEVYRSESPDIVFMDLMMPRMDGFEAIRRIREMGSERWVPIVIVSAMDAEYDVVRGLEAGADDYLIKPLSYLVFAAKMKNLARALDFQANQEEALNREAALSDAVVDGILSFDEHLCVLGANRAAQSLFHCGERELQGLDLRDLLHEGSAGHSWVEMFRARLQGGEEGFFGRLFEVTAQRPDAFCFPCEICVSELPVADRRAFIAVVRDISQRKAVERQLQENAGHLQRYHDEAEAEAELAKEVMERQIRRDALEQSGVQHFVLPTHRFSGDIVLAARSRSGRLYAMLADATGHGLAAAMSGLAIVHDFYRAVEEECPLSEMVLTLNSVLTQMLPVGRFVSAALVVLDEAQRCGTVWLGGMPELLRLSPEGEVLECWSSDQLPLGIEYWQLADLRVHSFEWQSPAQLMLCSDGVIEAEAADGNHFGFSGVRAALRCVPPAERLIALRQALSEHLGGNSGHDDISVLLLDLPV